jgi:hypothetical protein
MEQEKVYNWSKSTQLPDLYGKVRFVEHVGFVQRGIGRF